MNNLIFSCAADLPQPAKPCIATEYGNAVKLVMSKALISSSSDVPSASDFLDAYSSGLAAVIGGFTNFSRTQNSATVIDDPRTGKSINYDASYIIQGKIRRIDAAVQRLTERLDRYKSLYLYYITDRNYCFGPYKCRPQFSLIRQAGQPITIDFLFHFFDRGIDYSRYDQYYYQVPGYLGAYLLTEDDNLILTEDGFKILI